MAETYPLRASGEYAGTKCPVKTCTHYARFLLTPVGADNQRSATCATHLAVTARTLTLLTSQPLLIQEVPGKWSNELVLVDGVVARLQAGP